MADDLLCPSCRHPKRRHTTYGCLAASGARECAMTPAEFEAPAELAPAVCGEVGTSFTTDHEPHFTAPCTLPAEHDEPHDWAQREAAGEPSPAELAESDADEMAPPCQPIGCDNGYHLPGCPYAAVDADTGPAEPEPAEELAAAPVEREAPKARTRPWRTGTAAYAGPGDVLHSYSSFACLGCGSRRFEAFECCNAKALPVTITVSRREVSGG